MEKKEAILAQFYCAVVTGLIARRENDFKRYKQGGIHIDEIKELISDVTGISLELYDEYLETLDDTHGLR